MSGRAQQRAFDGCREVPVLRGRVDVAGGYYVVTLDLECGHQVVGRLRTGWRRRRWGSDIGSLNRKKADRWAAMKTARCVACGPAR